MASAVKTAAAIRSIGENIGSEYLQLLCPYLFVNLL
jgi:hypothetical protein